MTESEFNQQAEAIFSRIENAFDQCAAEVDCSLNQGVLEIDLPDGSTLIVNRHAPMREIWLAAKSGAFHFSWQDGRWLNRRDGGELFSTLSGLLASSGVAAVSFD